MSNKLSKLREAIDHLESAELLLLETRRAYGQFTLEYDKLTYHADQASKAAEAARSVLAHAELCIYHPKEIP